MCGLGWVGLAGVVPGMEHPNVLSYVDVLRGNAHVGQRVAVIGAGGIGFDVAEFLTHSGEGEGEGKAKGEGDTEVKACLACRPCL